jgi:hypothetical protein
MMFVCQVVIVQTVIFGTTMEIVLRADQILVDQVKTKIRHEKCKAIDNIFY